MRWTLPLAEREWRVECGGEEEEVRCLKRSSSSSKTFWCYFAYFFLCLVCVRCGCLLCCAVCALVFFAQKAKLFQCLALTFFFLFEIHSLNSALVTNILGHTIIFHMATKSNVFKSSFLFTDFHPHASPTPKVLGERKSALTLSNKPTEREIGRN